IGRVEHRGFDPLAIAHTGHLVTARRVGLGILWERRRRLLPLTGFSACQSHNTLHRCSGSAAEREKVQSKLRTYTSVGSRHGLHLTTVATCDAPGRLTAIAAQFVSRSGSSPTSDQCSPAVPRRSWLPDLFQVGAGGGRKDIPAHR